MSCNQSLTIYRGTTKIYEMTFAEEGQPVDINGWTLYFTVKRNKTDSTEVIKKIVTSHYEPEGGLTKIELSATDTRIDPGTYYYDLQYKDDDGKIVKIMYGQFIVIQNISEIS